MSFGYFKFIFSRNSYCKWSCRGGPGVEAFPSCSSTRFELHAPSSSYTSQKHLHTTSTTHSLNDLNVCHHTQLPEISSLQSDRKDERCCIKRTVWALLARKPPRGLSRKGSQMLVCRCSLAVSLDGFTKGSKEEMIYWRDKIQGCRWS